VWAGDARINANGEAATSSVDEALEGLAGDLRDELEVLIVVENDEAGTLGRRGDEEVGNRRGAMLSRSASSVCTRTARSSTVGVAYSIGIEPTGGP